MPHRFCAWLVDLFLRLREWKRNQSQIQKQTNGSIYDSINLCSCTLSLGVGSSMAGWPMCCAKWHCAMAASDDTNRIRSTLSTGQTTHLNSIACAIYNIVSAGHLARRNPNNWFIFERYFTNNIIMVCRSMAVTHRGRKPPHNYVIEATHSAWWRHTVHEHRFESWQCQKALWRCSPNGRFLRTR